MDDGYVLEWLDTLVTVTLNPAKTEIKDIMPEDITAIKSQLVSQKDRIQSAIKSAVFDLNEDAKIRCLIKKYHASLVSLLDQAVEDQSAIRPGALRQLLDAIVVSLDESLLLIEGRFKDYLSREELVPVTYLAIKDKEWSERLSAISEKFQHDMSSYPIFAIVEREVGSFIGRRTNRHSCTFREMFYIGDLVDELARLNPGDASGIYSNLDELLICINFNSRPYIRNLISRLASHVDSYEQTGDRMERLLLQKKIFKQFYRRPDAILHMKDAGIDRQVDNWFYQEALYFEEQQYFPDSPREAGTAKGNLKSEKVQKIVANLSVDQMALILRAADDLRIIVARSLNSVFKHIVPHLSTPARKNISYDSMRSKSYAAESRDKAIVIETLQQMISRINEY